MTARPSPPEGSIFLDARGGGRVLRATWHHESGLMVLSLWRENLCVGTFRLPAEQVPDLVAALRAGLDDAYRTHARAVETQPIRVAEDAGHAEAG